MMLNSTEVWGLKLKRKNQMKFLCFDDVCKFAGFLNLFWQICRSFCVSCLLNNLYSGFMVMRKLHRTILFFIFFSDVFTYNSSDHNPDPSQTNLQTLTPHYHYYSNCPLSLYYSYPHHSPSSFSFYTSSHTPTIETPDH